MRRVEGASAVKTDLINFGASLCLFPCFNRFPQRQRESGLSTTTELKPLDTGVKKKTSNPFTKIRDPS